MSGHSKWSTIKRKKGALDAKRGKIFTKLNREITVAIKEGGPNPEANTRLKIAIQNAKGANMPKDNIDRAIKKASGEDADNYQELTYEGYGPHGIAIYVECTTDNQNRTVQNVRHAFTKHGGSLGTNGSLEFLFERKGSFQVAKPEGFDEDEFTLEVIDGGAEDLEVEEEYVTVTCAFEDFGKMQKKLDEMNVQVENAELQRVPANRLSLGDEEFVKVMKLIDALEDDDDVQKVFHNLEITEAQMELI
ncbi:YebC/PmpR family DNA-binding transcriptional regulator [uncultured Imperialibacter sp.]|uniref:YebC/PmpR family DNA-binding transcriptional regulator n=1 Tax=uncultured Imperialibacter sp. TaxID=1672639 RepID=UPI0030DBFEE6|tara:strand:- start:3919 stop:4662 length:744 start_codon:yes stop_codon:yes gene_type:complete